MNFFETWHDRGDGQFDARPWWHVRDTESLAQVGHLILHKERLRREGQANGSSKDGCRLPSARRFTEGFEPVPSCRGRRMLTAPWSDTRRDSSTRPNMIPPTSRLPMGGCRRPCKSSE